MDRYTVSDKPKLLLIDINVLGIGSMRQWAYKDKNYKGKPTAAIHGTLDKLSQLVSDYVDHVPIILWDDRCHWREQILPSYKRHRWTTPEQQAFLKEYLAQSDVIRELVGHLGIPQIFCPAFEADDLAGLICRGIDRSWPVALATSDSDWFQVLRENVLWVSPMTGKRVTLSDLSDTSVVKDGPFHSTDHYIQSKALAGDTSDGIPGAVGVGLKTAAKFIRDHGSMQALWGKHDAGEAIKGAVLGRVASHEYRDTYHRNLQLIDWRLAPPLPAYYVFQHGAPNQHVFESTCADWGTTRNIRDYGANIIGSVTAARVVTKVGEILSANARQEVGDRPVDQFESVSASST